jgi:lambda repressor-like predicted transcriptional regulator
MPNVLKKEKQIAIVSGLAEGMSMRALSRVTGVHQDTICGLAVRVGQGCAQLLDEKLRICNATIWSLMRFGASSARRKSTA